MTAGGGRAQASPAPLAPDRWLAQGRGSPGTRGQCAAGPALTSSAWTLMLTLKSFHTSTVLGPEETDVICLKKWRGGGTQMQRWIGHREVFFHSPKGILSGISKKLLLLRAVTHEKTQACIPFLCLTQHHVTLFWVLASGERPFFFLLGNSEAPTTISLY